MGFCSYHCKFFLPYHIIGRINTAGGCSSVAPVVQSRPFEMNYQIQLSWDLMLEISKISRLVREYLKSSLSSWIYLLIPDHFDFWTNAVLNFSCVVSLVLLVCFQLFLCFQIRSLRSDHQYKVSPLCVSVGRFFFLQAFGFWNHRLQ